MGQDAVGQSLLVNCIFRDNTAGLGSQIALNGNQPADVIVTYSNVHGGELDIYVEPGFTLTWGPGNIDADPRFADLDIDGDVGITDFLLLLGNWG